VVDVFVAKGKEGMTYDLPFWYKGHFMKSSFSSSKNLKSLSPLGEKKGYQHIWQESISTLEKDNFTFNWFGDNKFYTLNGVSSQGDQIILGRAGANDPNFNLRADPVLIHRVESKGNTVFFNIIESHGQYDRVSEIPNNPYGQIEDLKVIYSNNDYIICSFANQKFNWKICLALSDSNPNSAHELKNEGENYNWNGVYKIIKTKK